MTHIDPGEPARDHRSAGMPAEFAAALAAVEEGVEAGRVTTAVLDLTGRPPRAFAGFVRHHAAEWAVPDTRG